jgi:hypothetical protein
VRYTPKHEWARKAGFTNINLDLLLGFSGQSDEGLLGDLEKTVALSPEHVSPPAYSPIHGTSLAPVEAGARLGLAATADCFLEDHGYPGRAGGCRGGFQVCSQAQALAGGRPSRACRRASQGEP